MPNKRKDSEFLKLDSAALIEQQKLESEHRVKPFLTKLVNELLSKNLVEDLPRTKLCIHHLFVILSSYYRKKLFTMKDIEYFLANLFPEVNMDDFVEFESDYLTNTTLELFIKPFYDTILRFTVVINNVPISMRIDETPQIRTSDYDKLSVYDKVKVCENLYMYDTYLNYERNFEDFTYFSKLKIRFDNLTNELLPAYICKADALYNVIQKGFVEDEPELILFKSDSQYNKLQLQIKNHLTGQSKMTDEQFKKALTSDTSPVVDQILTIFNNLKTDDPTEYDKFITTIPVELKYRSFIKDVFTNWMLHCMNQWFSLNGAVNKYILILQGEQNCGKDNFIKNNFLSPFKELVAENFTFNTDNKDQIILLASKLFALDGEMVCTTKQDITQIKKITGQNSVDYRTPYATKSMNYKRNINFIGLTNNDEIYRDESMSGGVRFLIISLNERFKFKTAYEQSHVENENTKAIETINWSKVWGYVYHLFLTDPNIIQKTGYIHKVMVQISEANRIKNPAEEAINSYVKPNSNVKYALSARQIKDYIIELNAGLSKIIESISPKLLSKFLKNKGIESFTKSHINYYLCEVRKPLVSTDNNLNPNYKESAMPNSFNEVDWLFKNKNIEDTDGNISKNKNNANDIF